ncbi:MAG: hypothetical protein KAX24_00960 [Anaerolineae bacterium]|nr:hypothetical protein [Anaerolineae bacterium]
MTTTEHPDSINWLLLTDLLIFHSYIVREQATLTDGHLPARLTLSDGSPLEFSEYAQRSPSESVHVVTYSYHRADTEDRLIRRWDNTHHFPNLPGTPHHIHDGHAATVSPGQPVNVFAVLDEITRRLQTGHKNE